MGALTLDNNYATVSHNNKSKNADKKEIKTSVIYLNVRSKFIQDNGYPRFDYVCNESVKDIYLNKLDEVIVKYEKEPEIKITGKSEIPFELNEDFHMEISLKKHPEIIYPIDIPKGYRWDGASIPKVLRMIIGENFTPEYALASLVHDKMCENHNIIDNNMNLSTAVFCALLKAKGVSESKADIMSFFVNLYQHIFGGWKNKKTCDSQNSKKFANKNISINKPIKMVA